MNIPYSLEKLFRFPWTDLEISGSGNCFRKIFRCINSHRKNCMSAGNFQKRKSLSVRKYNTNISPVNICNAFIKITYNKTHIIGWVKNKCIIQNVYLQRIIFSGKAFIINFLPGLGEEILRSVAQNIGYNLP